MNSSKAREQKPDLRHDKHAMNALLERQGGRQSSDTKRFMKEGCRQNCKDNPGKTIIINTEVGEKGREKLYLPGMERIRNPDAVCEMFKLGCEP